MNASRILASALVMAVLLAAGGPANAQSKKSDGKVKATASAKKAGGQTTVTITLEVEKSWYLYANPVGHDDFASNRTEVEFKVGGKKVAAKIEYPAGEVKKDKTIGDLKIYKDKVTITAVVDTTEAITAEIKVNSCSLGKDGRCLLPGTVTLKIAE